MRFACPSAPSVFSSAGALEEGARIVGRHRRRLPLRGQLVAVVGREGPVAHRRPRLPRARRLTLRSGRAVSSTPSIEELRAEANYHRDRLTLYRRRALTGRETTQMRMRELERAAEAAQARLQRALDEQRGQS
jgi:hypothetical protein